MNFCFSSGFQAEEEVETEGGGAQGGEGGED